MTRDDLLTELTELERLFDDAIIVTRVIIDAQGRELSRVSRVYLQPPPKEKAR